MKNPSSSQMSTNNIIEFDNESTVFLAVNSSCISNMENWYVDSGAAHLFTMRYDWMDDFKGFTVMFYMNGCRVIDNEGELCDTASKVNNVFNLDLIQCFCMLTKGNENTDDDINGSEVVGKNKSSSITNGIDLKDDESNLKLETELTSVRNPPLKRSDRPTKPINSSAVLLYTTESIGDLMDVEEAINCPESELWRKGNMVNIFNSLQEKKILGSTEMPPNRKAIGVKCVFRKKKRYVKRIMRYLKSPLSVLCGYSDNSIELELLPTVGLLNGLVQLTLANRVRVKQREYSANGIKKVRQLSKLFGFHPRTININQHSTRRYIFGGHPCIQLGTEFMTSDILTLTKPLIKLKRLKFTLIMGLFILIVICYSI